ncbi:MAG: hypothetical protein K0Q51_539 [Rickettsiaceae bacterium]|jgi:hypothetical protein|nr:hypothetical protein [Rickettsiaceae bacterium]
MTKKEYQKEQSRNPADIARDLKSYLFELTHIVERENELLEKHQIDEVLRIIPIKLEILEQIETFEAELKANAGTKNLDKETKRNLIDTHLSLCNLLAVNHSKLEVAKSINHQIMDMLSDQMIESNKQYRGYNAEGEILAPNLEYKHMPPITLNQKV